MDETKLTNQLADLKHQIKERTKREKALFTHPDTMSILCAHVACGGTITTLAEIWDLNYGKIAVWVNKDQERRRQLSEAYQARSEWAKERILHELRMLAHVDVSKIMNADGGILPVDQWPNDVARSVESIDVQEVWGSVGGEKMQTGVIKKVRFTPKLKALELLGKTESMFINRVEVTGAMTLVDLVNASWNEDGEKDVTPQPMVGINLDDVREDD